MSSLTPNFNLKKPDPNDLFELFRQWYNDNLDIIDANLGGGGSGGHTIVDPNGTDMPTESKLQFTGNVTVTDDSVNGKTVVDIPTSAGAGHTIINPSGTSMTQRNGLKFTGNVTVTDDSVNNETIVNVTGGGGSVNYSLTEQVIGTWIDGKPLYQITFEYHGNINSNATTVFGNATALSIETYVGGFGSAYESGWGWASFPESDIRLRYNETNGDIQIDTQSIGFVNTTAFATIWYTKTTD